MLAISIDFRSVEADQALIPVTDRGFLYGDSVYEVVRTWRGGLLFTREHLERLARSAAGIMLDLAEPLERYAAELQRMNALAHATLSPERSWRLIVTRGSDQLDLSGGGEGQRVVVIGKSLTPRPKSDYQNGVALVLAKVRRDAASTADPALKTGKYVTNMLAAREAKQRGAEEALMLNREGAITECTTSNLFFVKDGVLKTPALAEGVLAGVTRAQVLLCAAEAKIPVEQGHFSVDELREADEAFITSSSRDVLPVTRFEEAPIASGAPGELTKTLLNLYRQRCDADAGA